MKLSYNELKNKEKWHEIGVAIPNYTPEEIVENTKKNPIWIHFGAGNIFRGYIAGLHDKLLNDGVEKEGIIAAETFDFEIIDKIYTPYDNLTLMVTLKPDGTTENKVISSITEGIKADFTNPDALQRLKEIVSNPGLQMISFTVTEKGYALKDLQGNYFPIVEKDMKQGPEHAAHVMSIVTALLYERYQAGKYPIAVVSMDNCSHNGEKLQTSIVTLAKEWCNNGFAEAGFVDYLKDEKQVSFPWSMIDKITPRPAKVVEDDLTSKGIEEMAPVITNRNTYIAPFVNAEGPQYLVIEDKFPNGRPALEKAGVYLTDRDTVNNVERMKVTTCLNPLHTALAVYGCILGYSSIAEEMNDEQLVGLIKGIGYDEGMKVVTDPGIISPKEFIDEVINERLPNPFIPDTPQRIATDTSQKIPVRYGETIKSYVKDDNLSVETLKYIPLAIAGWLRYLLGLDDELKSIELSSDPMLDELKTKLTDIKIGDTSSYNGQLKDILSNENIFGINLYTAGLANKVETMFLELIEGKDAVRNTLKKYVI